MGNYLRIIMGFMVCVSLTGSLYTASTGQPFSLISEASAQAKAKPAKPRKNWIDMPIHMQKKQHNERKRKAALKKQREAMEALDNTAKPNPVSPPANAAAKAAVPAATPATAAAPKPEPAAAATPEPVAAAPAAEPLPQPVAKPYATPAVAKPFVVKRTAAPARQPPAEPEPAMAASTAATSTTAIEQPAAPLQDPATAPNKVNKGGIGAVGGLGRVGNPHVK
jgi:hypothetical protein